MNQPDSGIISWFVRNPVSANLLLISVIIMGIMSIGDLRKEAFPGFEPRFIRVSMNYDSGDAKQAEEGIAIKIEDSLETVPGIRRITSTSNANGSSVSVEKQADYDLDTLLADIKTNIDSIYNFPSDAEKPVITKGRMQDHALWVQLYGDTDRATLQKLADRLKLDLMAKPSIREVSIVGKAEPMMSIEINEGKLQAFGLTLKDIADTINKESSTALTTSLRNDEKVIRLKASEQAYRAQEFAQIPLITTSSGSVIRLGDVATVEDMFADDTLVLSRYNQHNGISLQVLMDEYGDINKIVTQSHEVVDYWEQRGLLPENVELETWFDRSVQINNRLALLTKNAVTGIALVFIILALFLNLRVAFWVAAGLPFIFFGTLYFMTDTYTGMTINQLTTFGFIMALGIVVDDAVVIGESIYTTRKEEGDTLENTIRGAQRVALPTVFGVLTTVVTFMSLSLVSGLMGELYAQFGTIVSICLLLSVVESKLILPSHLANLDTHRKIKPGFTGLWSRIQHRADSGLQWFNQNIYCFVIGKALEYRYAVILGFIGVLIFVLGMPLTGQVKVSFFPNVPGDVVQVNMIMQDDASFGQTEQNLQWLEETLLQADAYLVKQYNMDSSGIKSLQVLAESDAKGSMTVELDSSVAYISTELVIQWRKRIGSPEGVKQLRIDSRMRRIDDFNVELKGASEETVLLAGAQFKKSLEKISGVSGINDNMSPGESTLRFEVTAQGRAMGMDTATLSRQLLQAFGGEIVQRYLRGKDEVKVRVRYPEDERTTSADIMQARVRLPNGTVVPLSTVAKIIPSSQKNSITRIDGLRAVSISATVDKSIISPAELVRTLKRDLAPELTQQLPDLIIHFAGEAEEQEETSSSLISMSILALMAIYILLAIPLKSYTQPLLIMTAIPFGVVGAILGHVWNDLSISLLSLNGILALSGVVVNDSLLLVSRFNELVKEGGPIKEIIVKTCSGRLRAVLLTSFTTFAGLYPILGEESTQAQFLIPAAVSLGYGILFATLITLVLIPILLFIHYEIKILLGKQYMKFSNPVEA